MRHSNVPFPVIAAIKDQWVPATILIATIYTKQLSERLRRRSTFETTRIHLVHMPAQNFGNKVLYPTSNSTACQVSATLRTVTGSNNLLVTSPLRTHCGDLDSKSW